MIFRMAIPACCSWPAGGGQLLTFLAITSITALKASMFSELFKISEILPCPCRVVNFSSSVTAKATD